MAITFNQITLLGRVGTKDVRTFDSGKIVTLSLATTEKYTNRDGEKVEQTTWHTIKCAGRVADIAEQYVEKGAALFVQGKQTYRKYTNRDGVDVTVGEVIVQNLQMLGSRKDDGRPAPSAPRAPKAAAPEEVDLPTVNDADDLPF